MSKQLLTRPFKNPGRTITAVSVIGYRFLKKKPPQNIAPSLSTFSGTIRETINDVVSRFKGVTADFSTSNSRMAI